jgi:hypothetical protein
MTCQGKSEELQNALGELATQVEVAFYLTVQKEYLKSMLQHLEKVSSDLKIAVLIEAAIFTCEPCIIKLGTNPLPLLPAWSSSASVS